MNAVSLYVTTFSAILDVEASEKLENWTEVHRLLLSLRDQLSCGICKQLLCNAMHVPNLPCAHIICEKCINSAANFSPKSCENCSSHNEYFVPNKEMDMLIMCFKKMCEHSVNTQSYKKFAIIGQKDIVFDGLPYFNGQVCNSVNSHLNNTDGSLQNNSGDGNITNEVGSGENSHQVAENNSHSSSNGGAGVIAENGEIETMNAKLMEDNLRLSSGSETNEIVSIKHKFHQTSRNAPAKVRSFLNEKKSRNTVVIDGKKIVIKQEIIEKPKVVSAYNRQVKPKPNGCKCGLATAVPGKLTCCGQRCPCYVNGKACLSCKCRGCRNPQNRRLQSRRTDDKSPSVTSLPLAASHSLISISKSNCNHTTDEEGSDVDIDN